ncbi:hypothetical protein [Enterococcus timonensis]|uniref:hypothetical protein n=1 Tax=Enterococcus timonensis TaxID=1852364 RepID=UPI0008DA46D8|nr:hypothetical protein [Enterococcus timonensis]
MVGFNNSYNHRPEPSDFGENFVKDAKVSFVINGRHLTGTVTKQLTNSAVVEIDQKPENEKFVFQTNGVVVINYKKLERV